MLTETWSSPQPGETEVQFAAFVAYRDMGLPRSLTTLAKTLKCKPQTLWNLSSRMHWGDRIRAFNTACESERAEVIMDRQRKSAQIESEIEHKALSILLENFKRIEREQTKDENYVLPTGAAAQVYDLLSRAARAGRGKATDIVENRGDTAAELAGIVGNVLKGLQNARPQPNA